MLSSQKEVVHKKLTFARIQSPSSINTYRQCPRKYYYHYIEKIPSKPSIHLTRGKIAHSVLEDFFKIKVQKLPEENFMFVLKVFINDVLKQYWQQSADELNKLPLSRTQLDFYHRETQDMINLWYAKFLRKLALQMEQHTFSNAFDRLTPKTEEYYESKLFGIRGYIDAVHEMDGKTILIDYKTSKRAKMSPDYRLQLALYAMMYEEKHGSFPHKVALDFIKHGDKGEIDMDVDDDLVMHAKCESELIHINTQSKDKQDYPMKPGPLCKWSTGACDHFKSCFGNANSQYGNVHK
jgi:CRISPR/Cas system-associated exonuclease Cas4 (RecB family)